ncbi:RNA-guided endonuclease InsQ/TnpB family protein [Scytonema sp. PCC 10023]|uniref:RNA-guided endonuclease InsQ/TnpB family protein n=1 Tax=Scytonema sp. PCC 10023 TaxID=1680591 RepID=UPI0039C5CD7A
MSLLGFKAELDLTNRQKTLCAKHAGVARHAYNWGLALCKQVILHNKANPEDKIKFPTAIDLHKLLVATVKVANPWYYEVSKCAPQEALRNLGKAFKRLNTVKGSGFPKFKNKGCHDSFYLEGSIAISGNRIKLPVIGWVKCYERLPCSTPKNVTVSRRAGRWFVSFKVEVAENTARELCEPIGVDLGVQALATCSNGFVYPNPKAYRRAKKRLARLQKQLCRRQKGGKNREKTKFKLARLHYRISNIRKDRLHKITSYLTKNHSEIWIESLNVSGMLQNHKLAAAISDCGFYEFKRQLEYKTALYGSKLYFVDQWFPSSQICSGCGARQPMPLSLRQYDCPKCGISIDRDLNAAINLLNYARIAQPCQPDDGSCSHAPSQELNSNSTAVDLGKF